MTLPERLRTVVEQYDFSNIITGLITLAFCLVLELFSLPLKQTSLYKLFHPGKSVISDLIIAPLYILGILSIVKAVVLFDASVFTLDHLQVSLYVQSPVLLFFIYLAITDFLNYWVHRLHRSWQCGNPVHRRC